MSSMNQPAFVSIAPRFVCQNMEQALAFYGSLGFQTTYRDEAFAIILRDGIDLHLNYFSRPSEMPLRVLDWRDQYRGVVSTVSANPCRSVSPGNQTLGAERVFRVRSL